MFTSRNQAGQLLADRLQELKIKADVVVGIPRGGVVVAAEIAKELNLPLDVVVVKKLGAPHNPELAIGAIADQGVRFIDEHLAVSVGVDTDYITGETKRKRKELRQRISTIRKFRPAISVIGQSIILADDGAATGATFFTAILYLRKQNPKKIIAAIPVVAKDTAANIRQRVDQTVINVEPETFGAVGQFYQSFPQVTDEEVVALLRKRH